MLNDPRKNINTDEITAKVMEELQSKGFITQDEVKALILETSETAVTEEKVASLIAEAIADLANKETVVSLIAENETFKHQETPPTAADSTGTKGTVSWDTNCLYLCTATDTWVRIALTAW